MWSCWYFRPFSLVCSVPPPLWISGVCILFIQYVTGEGWGCVESIYRSNTLCIWQDTEPSKLLYHPRGPQTVKHLPARYLCRSIFNKNRHLWFGASLGFNGSGSASCISFLCTFSTLFHLLPPQISLCRRILWSNPGLLHWQSYSTGYKHCYPGQRLFAVLYRTVHFLSSICFECIQCWASFQGQHWEHSEQLL
jgi:hypothetical protein